MDNLNIKKQSLFVITGASGIGKSKILEFLPGKDIEYTIIENENLFYEFMRTPKDSVEDFKKVWLSIWERLASNKLPVILNGIVLPENLNICNTYQLFSKIRFIMLVCDEYELENRLKNGRGIDSEFWINSSKNYNQMLKEIASIYYPPIKLLDISDMSPDLVALNIQEWIVNKMLEEDDY